MGHVTLPAPLPGDDVRCGSWRVTRLVEGYEHTVEWCSRTAGPCPYPGTLRAHAQLASPEVARECAVQ